MPEISLLLIVVAVFTFAGAIKGLVGVGLPMVAVGLMTTFVGLHEAIQVVVMPAIITNIWQAAVGGRFRVLTRRLWPMLVTTVIFTWVGGWLLTFVDPHLLSGVTGILLTTYALVSMFTPQIPPPGRWEPLLGPVFGGLGGITLGAAGTYTMPAALYLQALGLPRDDLVQAMGIAFTTATVALALSLGGHGLYEPEMVITSALAVIPGLLGMAAGQMIRKRVAADAFRRLFFIAMLLLGTYLAVRAFA